MVEVEITKDTYLILVLRYKEIFKRRSTDPEPPFEIDPHITEIKSDSINNEYMNARFTRFLRDLTAGDEDTKRRDLDELHKSFASLSEEDQSFARQFLNDAENGLPVEEGKSFTDYIAEYKKRSYGRKLTEIAQGLGVDIDRLSYIINLHPDESHINEYNRYDELFLQVDIEKARPFLEARLGKMLDRNRDVKMAADSFLRDIIINGI